MRSLDDLDWTEPAVRTRYPHMLALDAEVWTAYLREVGDQVLRVAYDVHVGTPVPLPPEATEMERRIADGVTRKRIDLVMESRSGLWVVELKPYGNHAALGQVLEYLDLFRREFTDGRHANGMIICAEEDVDIPAIAQSLGLTIFQTNVTAF